MTANRALYGFTSIQNIFDQRIVEVNDGLTIVSRAIQATMEEHNRQINALMGLFSTPTTGYKVRYKTPTAARLQPMDNLGRARPIRVGGFYDVAFPIQAAATSWGADYIAAIKMTVQEANDLTAATISADVRWVRDHLLAALFTNVSWTFDDDAYGSLTIKGLANSDTDLYLIRSGYDAPATDTHYLAQAASIADNANPFPTIYTELTEHPENGGTVVVLASESLVTSIQGLASFKEKSDPNIAKGANADVLVGDLGTALPGTLLGYTNKCWISEWKNLPSGYMLATTVDGGEPTLLQRQEKEAELQGFFMDHKYENHPFYRSEWQRRCGFGAYNRVGALAYLVGNASYSVPSDYTSPMP